MSCIFVGVLFMLPLISNAQTFSSSAGLSGYAWSSNIGWVSFAGSNYDVKIEPTGNLTGYAWSPNIGWITFDENSGCPSGSCHPKIDFNTNELSGWARALAYQDGQAGGWDGWISLNGSNHGSNTYGVVANASEKIGGYVWGSDVVGWMNFSSVSIDTPCTAAAVCSVDSTQVEQTDMWCNTDVITCTLPESCQPATATCDQNDSFVSAEPSVVRTGDTSTITWNASPLYYTSCSVEGHGDSWVGLSGTQETSTFGKSSAVYKLMCTELNTGTNVEVDRVEVRVLPIITEI